MRFQDILHIICMTLFMFVLLGILFIFTPKSYAYDTDQPFVMRNFSIRRPAERILAEPCIPVDRRVMAWRDDPSVLVSVTPKGVIEPVVQTKVIYKDRKVYVVRDKEEDVKVTATFSEE